MPITEKQTAVIKKALNNSNISPEVESVLEWLLEGYISFDQTLVAIFTGGKDVKESGRKAAKAVCDLNKTKGKNSFSATLRQKKIPLETHADEATNIPGFKNCPGVAIIMSPDLKAWRTTIEGWKDTHYIQVKLDDILFIRRSEAIHAHTSSPNEDQMGRRQLITLGSRIRPGTDPIEKSTPQGATLDIKTDEGYRSPKLITIAAHRRSAKETVKSPSPRKRGRSQDPVTRPLMTIAAWRQRQPSPSDKTL